MKTRALLLAFLVMLTTFAATAQVESGKVYRIVNKMYGTAAFEKVADNTVNCKKIGSSTDYNQMWIITETSIASRYTIQNVYTGRNLGFQNGTNVPFYTTTDTGYSLYINDNSQYFNGCYTITQTKNSNWAMHCAGSSTCVPWNASAEATNWTFEEVNITAEEIAAARETYRSFMDVVDNAAEIAAIYEPLFEDKACTTLKAEYQAMSDSELLTAITSLPEDLKQVVLKIKNNTWDTSKYEKDFRIYEYKPYSDVNKWVDILYTRLYSPIDNPTGICSIDDKSYNYVFVEEVPEGTTIEIAEMPGTGYFGTNTTLKAGMNIVPAAQANGVLYIRYICQTDTAGKTLADYPAVKIHIENGYVNGFWSKERGHTNNDWKYMKNNMFQNEDAIQVKGDYTLFSFRKKELLAACPEKITEVMALWDYWNKTQQMFMNIDKYYTWFNNLQLAMSDDNGFMDAGNHRTHYNNNTLSTIVNYDVITRDAGSAWGPNHEIGHNNQYAFEIVGTSEVSNNALANMVIFTIGTHTSRGNDPTNQVIDFENKVPYVVRGEKEYGSKLFSMTRMYFQLFLYTYAAGKCPDFYPRLFERLRYDRLVGWSTHASDQLDSNGYYIGSMNALNDQLKFAEICCELLQMDLSEFFESWGFFIPMKNAYVGDYGHHYVYLHQADIDASKARMQQYTKKGGHLMFLEDRVRPSKLMVNKELDQEISLMAGLRNMEYIKDGYRANYSDETKIGTVGDFGQWEDYVDESVKAQGYYFTNVNGKINILEDTNASGALGFKLYEATTGELLAFTNSKSMKIPAKFANSELKVVAAQADGTDYIVPSASEGPESMQYETLKASINNAKYVVLSSTTNDAEVGMYIADSIARLKEIYNNAKSAYDNKNTSVHSYAEWSSMLEDEYNKVINNDKARITLREGTYCNIIASHYSLSGRYLTWTSTNVMGELTSDGNVDSKRWMFECTGTPGDFRIKSANGYYISTIALEGDIYAMEKNPQLAIVFNVSYTADGKILLTSKNNTALAIGIKSSSNPIASGMSPNNNNSKWSIVMLDKNYIEFEKSEIATLAQKAKMTLIETSDTIELAKGDTIPLNKHIYSNDILLQDYIKALYNDYASIDINDTKNSYANINKLRVSLNNIEGKFNTISPAETTDGYIKWYTIQSKTSGKVWSVNESNKRLSLVEYNKENITEEMLWAIIPINHQGEYKFVNKKYEMTVYQFRAANGRTQNYYMVGDLEDYDYLPITFDYDNDNKGSYIYTGLNSSNKMSAAYDNGTTSISYNSANKSYWTFNFESVEYDIDLYNKFAELTAEPEPEPEPDTILGDITGDGEVNVGDVTSIVSMILDPATITSAADITGDGDVNVGDVTSLVSIILGTSNAAPARAAATRSADAPVVSAEFDEENNMYINVSNPDYPFTAIQFDLTIDGGIGIVNDGEYYDVFLGSRTTSRNHSAPECAVQPDGSLRVVILSLKNKLFEGTEGDVATVSLDLTGVADGSYSYSIKNIVLSDPQSVMEYPADVEAWVNVAGGVTGIDSIAADGENANEAIYDLSGRKVKNPGKGIYIVNGKKVIF